MYSVFFLQAVDRQEKSSEKRQLIGQSRSLKLASSKQSAMRLEDLNILPDLGSDSEVLIVWSLAGLISWPFILPFAVALLTLGLKFLWRPGHQDVWQGQGIV